MSDMSRTPEQRWSGRRTAAEIAAGVAVATGRRKADLVIRQVRIFHLTCGQFETADIAVAGDRIAGIGRYDGLVEINGEGLTAVPGFIDAHCHLESSMIRPYEFDRAVLPRGTTLAVCDPHELANVAGTAAFDYFLECAGRMIMDVCVRLSSCVPATGLDTAGCEAITAADLEPYLARRPELGLAEMMNVPGLVMARPDVMEKLALFPACDGHAPLVSGPELNACLAAGVSNDHESTFLEEAREKLRRGCQVLIREGSAAQNLQELLPLITIENAPFLCFCTDDRNPRDIVRSGHIDHIIRQALAGGADPLAVYRVASLSVARAFGFRHRGLIAPGYLGDIVLLGDLRACEVRQVIKAGVPVTPESFDRRMPEPPAAAFRDSIRLRDVTPADFVCRSNQTRTDVIGVAAGVLLTDHLTCPLPLEDGVKTADPKRDILKAAVLERHGKNGGIGIGFVKGFGLRLGALASSVGHDSHNVCVVGTSDADMAAAVQAIRVMGGGYAVAANGQVTACLPLPIGGLMSEKSAEDVSAEMTALLAAAAATGCGLPEPFQTLSFLPLPVIPHLRLTDCGLVDVDRFEIIAEP